MWQAIRARRLSGHRFNRQVQVGPYYCDFACRAQRLVIEIDGGQHGSEGGKAHDARRTAFLNAQGYQVIRFWNHEVLGNLSGVLFRIDQVLAGSPPPTPPFEGGEKVEPRTLGTG